MTAHCDSMEAYVIQEAKAGMGMDLEVADVKALAASILALRERAEAAEARADKAEAALRLLAREIVVAARRAAPTEGEA